MGFLAPATAPGRQTTIATRPDGPRAARKAARTAPANNQAAMKPCIDFILKPWSLASSITFIEGMLCPPVYVGVGKGAIIVWLSRSFCLVSAVDVSAFGGNEEGVNKCVVGNCFLCGVCERHAVFDLVGRCPKSLMRGVRNIGVTQTRFSARFLSLVFPYSF